MAEFGVYPRLESRIYTLQVPAHAVPVQLHIPLPGSGPRDFVFIPDGAALAQYPEAFAGYSHSDALRSVFRYIGEDRSVVPLVASRSVPAPHPSHLRFALARWVRTSTVPFPDKVHGLFAVPYGAGGQVMHEIVTAAGVPAVAEGAAL